MLRRPDRMERRLRADVLREVRTTNMKKVAIRKAQVWEDIRTGRRGTIFDLNGNHGWSIVWHGRSHSASRHRKENVLWKFCRFVDEQPSNVNLSKAT
jgi:hypothetical protein